MRWTAAGKGGGSSARRVSCDMDGVFHFPTDDPEHDPATLGGREVTVQWIMDGNEFNEDRYTPVRHRLSAILLLAWCFSRESSSITTMPCTVVSRLVTDGRPGRFPSLEPWARACDGQRSQRASLVGKVRAANPSDGQCRLQRWGRGASCATRLHRGVRRGRSLESSQSGQRLAAICCQWSGRVGTDWLRCRDRGGTVSVCGLDCVGVPDTGCLHDTPI